jgi:hypothetical protein
MAIPFSPNRITPPLLPNFGRKCNSEYRKYDLTLISEYRKVVNLTRDSIRGAGAPGKGQSMQTLSWASEHTSALQEFIARGMSFAAAADALNARFGTAYSRSAAIGRAKRIGLAVPRRSEDMPARVPKAPRPPKAAMQTSPARRAGLIAPPPAPERAGSGG